MSVFFVGDAYIGDDILASRAAGIRSYWKGKEHGWYRLKSVHHEFEGPWETQEEATRC